MRGFTTFEFELLCRPSLGNLNWCNYDYDILITTIEITKFKTVFIIVEITQMMIKISLNSYGIIQNDKNN